MIHIVPLGDLREHEDSESCWCGPEELDDDGDEVVFVHKAMDGRDRYESGELKLQ